MDWTTILVAGFAMLGTMIGSLAGIKQANKVMELRIGSLEKKMDKHNNLIERMTKLEVAFDDEKDVCERRFDIIEKALPRKAKEV